MMSETTTDCSCNDFMELIYKDDVLFMPFVFIDLLADSYQTHPYLMHVQKSSLWLLLPMHDATR